MSEVRKERLKLFANYLNIIAAGSMVASIVTEPFALAVSGRPGLHSKLPFILASFGLSLVFHAIAQAALGRLDR